MADPHDDADDLPAAPPLRRFLVGGMFTAGIGLLAAVVLAFVVNALAARLLDTADLAAFLLLISLAQTLGVVVELGLPPLVTRQLAGSSRRSSSEYLALAWRAVLVAALVSCVAGLFLGAPVARLITDQAAVVSLAPWIGVLVAARGFERLAGESFRGFHDVARATLFGAVWTQGAAALLLAAALVALGQGQASGHVAVGFYAVAGVSGAAVSAWIMRSHFRVVETTAPWRRIGKMLGESWPLIGHRGMFLLLQQAPLWVVGATMAASPTADFGLALRIVTVIAFPLLIVNQVVPPVIARASRFGDRQRLERTLRLTATLAAVPALLVLGCFVVLGGPILRMAFGAKYVGAAGILAVLSAGQIVNVLAGSCGPVLTQTGHQRELLRVTALSTATMLIGAVAVAPYGGTMGVAIVAAGGLVLQNVGMIVTVWRLERIRTYVGVAPAVEIVRLAVGRLRG